MQSLTAAAISTRNVFGEPDTVIQEMDKWLGRAAGQGAELALFPELNVSGYVPSEAARMVAETIPGPSTEKAVSLARRYQMTVAFGLVEQAGERLHCSHVLVNGDGLLGWQRKIHVPAQEQSAWTQPTCSPAGRTRISWPESFVPSCICFHKSGELGAVS